MNSLHHRFHKRKRLTASGLAGGPLRPLTPDARGIVQVPTRPGDKWIFAEDKREEMSLDWDGENMEDRNGPLGSYGALKEVAGLSLKDLAIMQRTQG